MKTTAFLTMAILLLFSCKKDKDGFDPRQALKGIYIGARKSQSTSLELIIIDPNTSYHEWVYDSSYQNPDTLILSEISADSFSIQGNVAKYLPTYWRDFAWDESPGTNGVVTFSRGLYATGYSQNLSITFQPDNKSVEVDYSFQTDYKNLQLSFEGGK